MLTQKPDNLQPLPQVSDLACDISSPEIVQRYVSFPAEGPRATIIT